MKRSILWGIASVVVLGGCVSRMPLDAVASQAINGRIAVTVLNGITPTAGVNVQVVAPNGSSQTLASSSSLQTPGQAVFDEPMTGRYNVSIANQPSQAPNIVPVTLTTANPTAAVSLQIGYGYLSITAADGKPFSYDETQTYHTFNITYINPTNQYNPGTTTLPPGWAVNLNTTTLRSGQSTQLIVQTAAMTVFGTVTITVTGLSNSAPITVAPIVLTQYWYPEIDVDYYENCSTNSVGAYYAYVNFLCERCTNSAETVVEKFEMAGNSCSSGVAYTNTSTLTDSLTVPDGNGAAMANGNACIGNLITLTSTFNGQNYVYTITPSGCYFSSDYPDTIVPSLLQ
jgi:hypothetical protein